MKGDSGRKKHAKTGGGGGLRWKERGGGLDEKEGFGIPTLPHVLYA